MNCTYLDHPAVATHHYDNTGGRRVYLCQYCADRFGYPQYLVKIEPDAWRPEYGYLVNSHAGDGQGDSVADVWPFDSEGVETWLTILGCPEVETMIADATWEPYRAHFSEGTRLVCEVIRVTCLPLSV